MPSVQIRDVPEEIREEAIRQLGGDRNQGEWWLPVDAAAECLKVSPAAIFRRAPRHLETRRLGDRVCVRVADLDRWLEDGLPYPELEQHLDGSLIHEPERWATLDRSKSPHGETAFVALRQLDIGSRTMQAGDILGEGEPIPDGHLIAGAAGSPTFAELPVDRGVLGLLRSYQARVAELEAQLARKDA